MTLQAYLSPDAARQYEVAKLKHKARSKPGQQSQQYNFYGNNRRFLGVTDHEKILSGPAETGKTITCLYALNELCWKYPGLQAAIVRKTYKSMPGSVLQIFENKVLPKKPTERGSRVHQSRFPPATRA